MVSEYLQRAVTVDLAVPQVRRQDLLLLGASA
jgi:hypothetical protein